MKQDLMTQIQDAAKALRQAGARDVYLFGSTTEDNFAEDSDVDLAVEGLPPERFYFAMGTAATYLDRPLDLIDLDEDTPFVLHLKQEGRLRRVG